MSLIGHQVSLWFKMKFAPENLGGKARHPRAFHYTTVTLGLDALGLAIKWNALDCRLLLHHDFQARKQQLLTQLVCNFQTHCHYLYPIFEEFLFVLAGDFETGCNSPQFLPRWLLSDCLKQMIFFTFYSLMFITSNLGLPKSQTWRPIRYSITEKHDVTF